MNVPSQGEPSSSIACHGLSLSLTFADIVVNFVTFPRPTCHPAARMLVFRGEPSYLAATGTSFFLIFLRCSNEMRRSKTDDSKCPANWRICSSCRYRYQHMPRDGHGCQANNILRKAHLLPLHSTIQYTSIDRLDLRFLSTYRGALALQISLWSNHGNRLLLQDSHHRTYSFGCLTHPGPAWPGHRRIAEYMFSERHKVFWHVGIVRLLSFPSLLRFKVVLFNRSLDQYLVKSVLSYV